MFTHILGRATALIAAAGLSSLGVTSAHAQSDIGLWIKTVEEVQGQLASHILRKFGLSYGELSFAYSLNQSSRYALMRSVGNQTYTGMPVGLAASIRHLNGQSIDSGSVLAVNVAGSIGDTPVNGSGSIVCTAFSADGGSLVSDMQIAPGGGPGAGSDDDGGGGDAANGTTTTRSSNCTKIPNARGAWPALQRLGTHTTT